MTKWLKLLLPAIFLLCFASSASAQASFFTGNAFRYTPAGVFAASGASVTICTSSGSGAPCLPTITVYKDAALLTSVANPLPVCGLPAPQFGCIDGLGNFSFYAATPGPYVYTVTGSGLTAYGPIPIYSSLSPGANIAFTGNNTFAGSTALNGGGSLSGTFSGTPTWSGLHTFSGGLTSSGTATFTGLMQCKNFENIQCVDSTFSRGGTDLGNEVNLAYAALPASGGTIYIFPKSDGTCYSFSTQIAFTTAGKYPLLQWVGPGGATSLTNMTNCLNYTPTSGSAITLDYAVTTQSPFSSAHGLRNLTLINNQCFTSGGCGGTAIGIDTGTTNAGAYEASIDDSSIVGFSVAHRNLNNLSVQIHWLNLHLGANGKGFLLKAPTGYIFTGGQFAGNGILVQANDSASSFEVTWQGVTIFANNTAFDCSAIVSLSSACQVTVNSPHLETNMTGSTPAFANGGVILKLNGGLAESDNAGTLATMFSISNAGYFSSVGVLYSAGGTVTQILSAGTSVRGLLNGYDNSNGHFTNYITGGNAGKITNMMLPGPSSISSTPWTFEPILRAPQLIADQGAVCTNGELALSAGWQSTGSATVTAVAGNGQTCSWTITTGTTTAANPTVTDTLTNALPNATTVCELNIHGGTHTFPASGEYFNQTTVSATAPVFTANFTPTAGGTTYFVTRRCGP